MAIAPVEYRRGKIEARRVNSVKDYLTCVRHDGEGQGGGHYARVGLRHKRPNPFMNQLQLAYPTPITTV